MAKSLIAPVYSLRRDRWRMNVSGAVRVPAKHELAPLKNQMPFFINIFDQAVAANSSAEDRLTVPYPFWWLASMSNASQGNFLTGNQPFGVQLFNTVVEDPATGAMLAFRHQQKPVDGGNFVGSAQKPGYLRKPKFFDGGTDLLIRVQNLQALSNTIQIVLFGYIPG